jgi:hypothetical protein
MVGLIFYGGSPGSLTRKLTIDLATPVRLVPSCAPISPGATASSITPVSSGCRRRVNALTHVNYAIIAAFLVKIMYAGTWLSGSAARSFQGIPASATRG